MHQGSLFSSSAFPSTRGAIFSAGYTKMVDSGLAIAHVDKWRFRRAGVDWQEDGEAKPMLKGTHYQVHGNPRTLFPRFPSDGHRGTWSRGAWWVAGWDEGVWEVGSYEFDPVVLLGESIYQWSSIANWLISRTNAGVPLVCKDFGTLKRTLRLSPGLTLQELLQESRFRWFWLQRVDFKGKSAGKQLISGGFWLPCPGCFLSPSRFFLPPKPFGWFWDAMSCCYLASKG